MMSDEMRRALAILDGTDKGERAVPREPGFYWSPQGHHFVVEASHAAGLFRAVRAEMALFGGDARMMFGVAIRLIDADGGAPPAAHAAYAWGADPGKWPVSPASDPRTVPPDERQVTITAVDAAGQPLVSRQMPLEARFAFALHNRVHMSRESNFSPVWRDRLAADIDRLARGGIDRIASPRSVADLLPYLEVQEGKPAPSAVT